MKVQKHKRSYSVDGNKQQLGNTSIQIVAGTKSDVIKQDQQETSEKWEVSKYDNA